MGILQSEADHIDEYLCPRCAPNSQLNVPNQKRLTADDYEAIKKLVKQLWVRLFSDTLDMFTKAKIFKVNSFFLNR